MHNFADTAETDIGGARGIGHFGLILLKNSDFGKIDEILARTAQPTFRGEGFGQIGLLPLMCQFTTPHGISRLTFRYRGFFRKITASEIRSFSTESALKSH